MKKPSILWVSFLGTGDPNQKAGDARRLAQRAGLTPTQWDFRLRRDYTHTNSDHAYGLYLSPKGAKRVAWLTKMGQRVPPLSAMEAAKLPR